MPLKALLDSLDGVDDTVKALYVPIEDDGPLKGKFKLDVIPVGGLMLDDPTPLKTALDAEKSAKEEAVNRLKLFGNLEPKKVHADLKRLDELSKIDPQTEAGKIAASQIEALKAEMTAKYDTDIAAISGERDALSGEIRTLLVTNSAQAAITKAQGNLGLLLPHVESAMKVVKDEKTGRFNPVVVDPATGGARIRDGRGNAFTAEDLVEELKGKFPEAFKGVGASGGGSTPHQGGGQPGATTMTLSAWQHKVSAATTDAERQTLLRDKAAGKYVVQG